MAISATNAGTAAGNALAAAGTGAAIGSAILPGVGTAVGAGVGALISILSDAFASNDPVKIEAAKAKAAESGFTAQQIQLAETSYKGAIQSGMSQQQAAQAMASATGQKQADFGQTLLNRAQGLGPSIAGAQLAATTNANIAGAAGQMAGVKGINQGLAARLIGQQQASTQQQAAGEGALLRAQEAASDTAAYQAALNAQRQGDVAQAQAGTALMAGAGGLQNSQNQIASQQNLGIMGINAGTANQNAANQTSINQSNAAQQNAIAIANLKLEEAQQARSDAQTAAAGQAATAVATNLGKSKPASIPATGTTEEGGNISKSSGDWDYAYGGEVDSPANDVIPAKLSPGEIIIPRSIAQHENAPEMAMAYVQGLKAASKTPQETPDFASAVQAQQSEHNQKVHDLRMCMGGGVKGYDAGGVAAFDPYAPTQSIDPNAMTPAQAAITEGVYQAPTVNPYGGLSALGGMITPSPAPAPTMAPIPYKPTVAPDASPAQADLEAELAGIRAKNAAPVVPAVPEPKAAPAAPRAPAVPTPDEYEKIATKKSAADQDIAEQERLKNEQAATAAKETLDNQKRIQQNAQQELQDRTAQAAKWRQDLWDSKIDPTRLWNNMSTEGKIIAGIGMLLGARGANATNGQNSAVTQLNKAVENDMLAQEKDIGKKQNILTGYLEETKDLTQARRLASADLKDALATKIQMYGSEAAGGEAKAIADKASAQYTQEAVQLRQEAVNDKAKRSLMGAQTAEAWQTVAGQQRAMAIDTQERATLQKLLSSGEMTLSEGAVPPRTLNELRERGFQLPDGSWRVAKDAKEAEAMQEQIRASQGATQALSENKKLAERGGVAGPVGKLWNQAVRAVPILPNSAMVGNAPTQGELNAGEMQLKSAVFGAYGISPANLTKTDEEMFHKIFEDVNAGNISKSSFDAATRQLAAGIKYRTMAKVR